MKLDGKNNSEQNYGNLKWYADTPVANFRFSMDSDVESLERGEGFASDLPVCKLERIGKNSKEGAPEDQPRIVFGEREDKTRQNKT